MTVLNPPRLSTRPGHRAAASKPHVEWTRDRLVGTVQIIGSAMLLAGIIAVYLLRPSVGVGASGNAGIRSTVVPVGSIWSPLLEDAQGIRMLVVTVDSDRVPESTTIGWSMPIKQLSAEIGALVASSPATVDDETLEILDEHRMTLASLEPSPGNAAEIGSALDGLIVELDQLADLEAAAMIARLESANRTAVQSLGGRALLIACTAFVAAVGVLGLGAGVQRVLSAEQARIT